MHIFYKPDIAGDTIILDETESKHCIKVLRLNQGDLVALTNGKGGWYIAAISEPHPKRCKLLIQEKKPVEKERSYRLHIAIAPTKNTDRLEWFLEKATEIGVDEVTLLLTFQSERKKANMQRLEKIVISAMKQSQKAWLPRLNDITPFQKFISQSFDGQKFIAHCHPGTKNPLKDMVGNGGNILILIGPEGDFSEDEVKAAREKGFKEISLGEARLRTETAGIVACHTVNLLNE